MADIDNFQTVADGDGLQDGYFNELKLILNKNAIQISNSIQTNKNYTEEAFASDTADLKTNLTYKADEDRYEGVGSASIVLESSKYSIKQLGASFDIFDTVYVDFAYNIFTVIDECSNSSIDTNLWTTSTTNTTATEDTDRLNITGTGSDTLTRIADLLSDTNHKGTDDTVIIRCKTSGSWVPSGSGIGTDYTVKISLYDTSNEVTIENSSGSSTSSTTVTHEGIYIFKFDNSAETVRVFKSAHTWASFSEISGSPFDISSLTTWRIRAYALTAEGSPSGSITRTSTVNCYWLRKVTGSETTTVTLAGSADDGSNYITTNSISKEAVISTDAQKGMDIQAKLTSSLASGEGITIGRVIYGARRTI